MKLHFSMNTSRPEYTQITFSTLEFLVSLRNFKPNESSHRCGRSFYVTRSKR